MGLTILNYTFGVTLIDNLDLGLYRCYYETFTISRRFYEDRVLIKNLMKIFHCETPSGHYHFNISVI
jgi:hypothetical protein